MRQKSGTRESSSERLVKNIRRATRKQYSSEEKIRIVLDGLRGECSIAELCRREGIAESLYYSWSKEFLEAGPRWTGENRPLIDTSKPATTGVATETGKFYFVASSGRKSVWTFVRQLRGPHFRTWAWCKRRSRSAVTAAVSLRSLPQSSTGRLDVRSVDARS